MCCLRRAPAQSDAYLMMQLGAFLSFFDFFSPFSMKDVLQMRE